MNKNIHLHIINIFFFLKKLKNEDLVNQLFFNLCIHLKNHKD